MAGGFSVKDQRCPAAEALTLMAQLRRNSRSIRGVLTTPGGALSCATCCAKGHDDKASCGGATGQLDSSCLLCHGRIRNFHLIHAIELVCCNKTTEAQNENGYKNVSGLTLASDLRRSVTA